MASTNTDQKTPAGNAPGPRCWRQLLRIHPACELFPLVPDDELRALGGDIKKHGLLTPIVLWVPADYHPVFGLEDFASVYLLDGRNRLAACGLVGIDVIHRTAKPIDYDYRYAPDHPDPSFEERIDPYEFVISANILRRHLATAQKHELTAALLRERPERSDRQIARLVGLSDKTVTSDRKKLEATAEIPQLNRTIGQNGKARPRGRVGRTVEAARHSAKRAGVSLDEYVRTIPEPGEKTPRPAGPHSFYTANHDANLDPNITAAIEVKTPLPALPRSRSLTPLSPRTNGAEPPGQERNETIAAIVKHLHHDPTMFLSDVAAIMVDDRARLARISIFNRRSALAKIAHSLRLRIAGDAKPPR